MSTLPPLAAIIKGVLPSDALSTVAPFSNNNCMTSKSSFRVASAKGVSLSTSGPRKFASGLAWPSKSTRITSFCPHFMASSKAHVRLLSLDTLTAFLSSSMLSFGASAMQVLWLTSICTICVFPLLAAEAKGVQQTSLPGCFLGEMSTVAPLSNSNCTTSKLLLRAA